MLLKCNLVSTLGTQNWYAGGVIREDGRMSAQILDGKATAAAIKSDLTVRVAALKAQGVTLAWEPCSSGTTRAAGGT